jgi:hypothetical protein
MLAFRHLTLAAVAVGLSGVVSACERSPVEAGPETTGVRLDGMVQSVDLAQRSLTLADGRVVRLDAAPAEGDQDPVILAHRVLDAGGTVRVSGTGAALAAPPSGGALAPQASFFSAFVIEFEYYLVDEVRSVEPALALYVLENGIPLRIDEGVEIDPAGDYTSLEEVGVALALGQRVNSTNEFLVRYTVYPFDVDLFLESVRFEQL